ncbi:MAG: IS21-like element helper ATPase IstB [Candidatus Competibacteraceae bacterium]|nr:IS21-like element helper ATPase IstB [Candidatus Competibacteraceae bacterium]
MLPHPTLSKLHTLRLSGMVKALQEQAEQPQVESLSFEERLGLLVDREITERDNRRLQSRLKKARLRQSACLEDIDYRHPRGLDRTLLHHLAGGQWLREQLNVLITGPTGIGKSFLACALAQSACRLGFSAVYQRLPRLLEDLALARGDGRYTRLLNTLARTDVLVLDDWGLTPLTEGGCRDLLEVLDDRYRRRSTVVTSQLPVEHWHDYLGHATLADAILDRLVHNSHRLKLKGESMRRQTPVLTPPGVQE